MNLRYCPPSADLPAGSLTSVRRGGLALYTGRNFERPFISYSVKVKIDLHPFRVKMPAHAYVHNSFTYVINNLLITLAR
jgi:hypothetical protein